MAKRKNVPELVTIFEKAIEVCYYINMCSKMQCKAHHC